MDFIAIDLIGTPAVDSYLKKVYCTFTGSWKILSVNSSEFRNKLLSAVATESGIEHIFYPTGLKQMVGLSQCMNFVF